jgi:hypothetical protein
MELAHAMTDVLKRINDFVAPMGGHVGRKITLMTSPFTGMKLSIGFEVDVLKQYMAGKEAKPGETNVSHA